MIFLGIDNGVTGSVGIFPGPRWFPMPTFTEQNYTKAKQSITRIDPLHLGDLIGDAVMGLDDIVVMIERPMVTPMRFKQSISAARALEAMLITLDHLGLICPSCAKTNIAIHYVDSREWQKALLPAGCEGPELKTVGLQLARRWWPSVDFGKAKDADGLLIGEYCRRKFQGQSL